MKFKNGIKSSGVLPAFVLLFITSLVCLVMVPPVQAKAISAAGDGLSAEALEATSADEAPALVESAEGELVSQDGGMDLLSTSTSISSVTGVLLGTGVTAYRTAVIDQASVYNDALAQVKKWRQDALDDTSVKFKYNGTYYTIKEYLSKIGISQSAYLNPQWSNALERIALQRAVEAWTTSSGGAGHTRLYSSTINSNTCFTAKYNGIQSFGEILHWGSSSITGAISSWASEKSDYIAYTNGDTSISKNDYGHYLQLIDPDNTHFGFANVGRTWAGETRSSLSSSDSTTPTKWTGSKTFEVALSTDKVV